MTADCVFKTKIKKKKNTPRRISHTASAAFKHDLIPPQKPVTKQSLETKYIKMDQIKYTRKNFKLIKTYRGLISY